MSAGLFADVPQALESVHAAKVDLLALEIGSFLSNFKPRRSRGTSSRKATSSATCRASESSDVDRAITKPTGTQGSASFSTSEAGLGATAAPSRTGKDNAEIRRRVLTPAGES